MKTYKPLLRGLAVGRHHAVWCRRQHSWWYQLLHPCL